MATGEDADRARRKAEQDLKRLATFYIVEATSHEMLAMWLEYAQQSTRPLGPRDKRFDWKEESMGYWKTIAEVEINGEKMPVTVSVSWAVICGKRVAFYEATSQVVDHRLVEKWRKKEFPNAKGHTNAMNFGHCLCACEAA